MEIPIAYAKREVCMNMERERDTERDVVSSGIHITLVE